MELYPFFYSLLEQDPAPVVICDRDSIIVYMNPAAICRYHGDLTGKSLKSCHPEAANRQIDRVLQWFSQSETHNQVYTYYNEEENKDVYMIALRDEEKRLIGYYEKHLYRNRETGGRYELV